MHVVEPYEATRLPELAPDPNRDAAMHDVATAIAGFAYPGDKSSTIVLMTRWLTHNPEWIDLLWPERA